MAKLLRGLARDLCDKSKSKFDIRPADLVDAADLLQRAQADALDARRYREVRTWTPQTFKFVWLYNVDGGESFDGLVDQFVASPAVDPSTACAALRTSSPDPVVPRGEDGEKGK